jgi:hypothetical protein
MDVLSAALPAALPPAVARAVASAETSAVITAISPGGWITLAVLAVAVVLFVGGWLAPEVTGLLAMGLLVATGVLKPSEAVGGFGSPALITLMGLFGLLFLLFLSHLFGQLDPMFPMCQCFHQYHSS